MDSRGQQQSNPEGKLGRWLAWAGNVGMGALIAGGGTAICVGSAVLFVWLLYLVYGPFVYLVLLIWPGAPIAYLVLSKAAISRAPAGLRRARLLGVTLVPIAVLAIFVVQPAFERRAQTQNQNQAASVLSEFAPDLDLASWRTLSTNDLGRCSVGGALTSRREQGDAADSFVWTQEVLAYLKGVDGWDDVETAHLRQKRSVGYGDAETSIIYATRNGASALFLTVYRDPGRWEEEIVDTDAQVRVWVGGCAGEQSIEDAIRSHYGYLGANRGADWDHWSDGLPDRVPDPISNR